MVENKQEILRVLVGSHAHGLATPESDRDYRSVYVTPTSELLRLGDGPYKGTSWLEGETEDNTAYELGHFLHLATKSNPSILEVFKAPEVNLTKVPNCQSFDEADRLLQTDRWGYELKHLFPYVWSSKGVYNAFKGYSHNQHKKMFDDREELLKRKSKYAVAHIRVLLSGIELLRTGDFHAEVQHTYNDAFEPDAFTPGMMFDGWRDFLKAVKENQLSVGEIVDTAEALKVCLANAYEANPDKETDYDMVNGFLLRVRKEVW